MEKDEPKNDIRWEQRFSNFRKALKKTSDPMKNKQQAPWRKLVRGWALLGLALSALACQKEEPMPEPAGDSLPYAQYGTPFDVPEIQDIVMYEVNLRAFGPGSDLQAVIDRLDHIESLGVNVLWLMPIYPVGQLNSVNSPYCVRDFKAVGQEYGSLDDLRRLTDQAHARGMAVIPDWVANHTAWDNPWIETPTWYTRDAEGNIVHPAGTNWLDVADLNYENHAMRAAMVDALKYWALAANIDGYRCDHADGVPHDFWQGAWRSLEALPGREFIFFAEGVRADHFDAGFDLNFGWQSYSALKDAFGGQPASRVFDAHRAEYQGLAEGQHWIRFTTNHDESAWDASPVSLFGGLDGALAASVLSIFVGGVPLIYGSQEVGTPGTVPFFQTSTIDWDANPQMLAQYRRLLGFYRGSAAARHGVLTVYPHDHVAAFALRHEQEEVLVLVNLRPSAQSFAVPAELRGTGWTDAMTQGPASLGETLALAPHAFRVLTASAQSRATD